MSDALPRRHVRVAAAALIESGRVLIVRRKEGEVGAGGWEFPGGKIEEGETPRQAVIREIQEELALDVRIEADLGWASHAYENLDLEMNVFVVRRIQGEISLSEHDALEWIEPALLLPSKLLPVDQPFVERLRAWMKTADEHLKVFVFPLANVTLFPHCTKPLNIFEPRYVKMIRDSVATASPVALAFIEDPALVAPTIPGRTIPFVRDVAGYGHLEIIEERDNGTLLVFLQGIGKCRLGEVVQENPYIVCRAEVIRENVSVSEELRGKVQVLNRVLARWITSHIPDADQRAVFLKNLKGPEDIVGSFATYLVKDYDIQQSVLELDGINEKIRFLHRLVESNEVSAD